MITRLTCFLIIFFTNSATFALPIAKITIKVVDEQGNPIENAKAGIALESPKSNSWGTNIKLLSGLTDTDGLFSDEGETSPYVGLSAFKEGYYGVGSSFNKFTDTTGILGFRKYQPWNPTVELVLKKVINPIPMYAIRMSGMRDGEYPEIPETGRFIGYDLTVNDWVVPYGLGTHKDFLFKVDIVRANTYRDYDVTLTLSFPNEGDGLIKYTPDVSKGKSSLRMPHNAPIAGYSSEFVRHHERTPNIRTPIRTNGNPAYDINYFFRIRTELDKDGNVTGGLYGKIYGEIDLGNFAWLHNSKPFISFNYYLNPTNNDTNIEFNPEKNIFKGIPDRLKVGEP